MLKKILIGLVGLILLVLLAGFLLPGKVQISRSITVNAPAEYAFEEVNALENHPKWSYWNSIYPNMTMTYGDIRTGTGALVSWEGEDSGTGSMTITESIPNSSIKMDLNFMDEGTALAWYTFEPADDGIKLTQGFEIECGYNPIMRIMAATYMKNEMNKAFDYNLTKIKELAEAKPKFTIDISEEETKPITYVGISSSMSFENMEALSAQMSKSYGELMGMLAKVKVEMTGAPFCIYNKWDEEAKQTDFVCALPVPEGAKLPAKYRTLTTAGGLAVKAIHKGDYEKLGDTHNQIDQYITFKNLQITGAPWEVYVTDPEMEKDTTQWVTEVYYPVSKRE
jgi:effector-binding domain-containing protein